MRRVGWQDTPLGRLQALPKDGKPAAEWKPVEKGLENIAIGIRKVVEEIQQAKRITIKK